MSQAKSKVGRRPTYSKAVAKARTAERNRRYVRAETRAKKQLAKRFPGVFAELMAEERRIEDKKCGPLPGDED